jgi:hypothetical protein
MEAADAILTQNAVGGGMEDVTESLLDVSLIKPVLLGPSAEPRFNMLQTVHEFAAELLDDAPECAEVKARFADYYLALAESAEGKLWTRSGEAWLDLIEVEYHNIRAALHEFVQRGDLQSAWRFVPALSQYWILRGGFSEAEQLAADARLDDTTMWASPEISASVRARGLLWHSSNRMMLLDVHRGFAGLHEVERIATEIGDEYALTVALVLDGCYGGYLNRPDAAEKLSRAFELAEQLPERFALGMLLSYSGEFDLRMGRPEVALAKLDRARALAVEEGFTYIHATAQVLKFGYESINDDCDWRATATQAAELVESLPAKGYKALKAGALQSQGWALLRIGEAAEAAAVMRRSLDYARQAGEMDAQLNGVLLASEYYMVSGDTAKAVGLFGSLDAFIAQLSYQLAGGPAKVYARTKGLLRSAMESEQGQLWYADGKRMGLTEALAAAMDT